MNVQQLQGLKASNAAGPHTLKKNKKVSKAQVIKQALKDC